jgi:hypothetical protein
VAHGGTPHPPGPWPYAAPPPRRNRGMGTAVAGAIMLAVAALVIGIIDLTHSSTPTATTGSSATASAAPHAATDPTDANRALCTAIAPLMTESNRVAKAYSGLGPAGTPSWTSGVATFISDTKDWVGRIQPVVDSHPDADPFFRRSLQRFIDDRRFLILDLQAPGPYPAYDDTIWNDSLAAGSGPLNTCWDLGVKW